MARLLVEDAQGLVTADVTTSGRTLEKALEHPQAEAVIRCAVLMALCALVEGDGWPDAALQQMSSFMEHMSRELRNMQLV
jgi:orotate phosphoribosyltransferase-like protein